jgi:hypothetical protein
MLNGSAKCDEGNLYKDCKDLISEETNSASVADKFS